MIHHFKMATVKMLSFLGDFLMKGCDSSGDCRHLRLRLFIYIPPAGDHFVPLVLECYCMVSDAISTLYFYPAFGEYLFSAHKTLYVLISLLLSGNYVNKKIPLSDHNVFIPLEVWSTHTRTHTDTHTTIRRKFRPQEAALYREI